MEVSKSDIKKWVKALRSGKYKQTRHKLQDQNGFCCLGVACEIFTTKKHNDESGFLFGVSPKDQVNAPEWLKGISKDFYLKTDRCVDDLNDNGIAIELVSPLTFDEMADMLEAVYIHEVLS